MKCLLVSVLGSVTALKFETGARFGPKHCVSVSKSEKGTCVLETKCKGDDISQVEFAFLCHNGESVRKHNFGVGGFDEEEEFDTGIKCGSCGLPNFVAQPKPKNIKKMLKKAAKKAAKEAKKDAPPQEKPKHMGQLPGQHLPKTKPLRGPSDTVAAMTVNFGPKGCVSTFQENGFCHLKTDCKDVPKKVFENYNVGFICTPPSAVQPPCEARDTQAKCETASYVEGQTVHEGESECKWKEGKKDTKGTCEGPKSISEPIRHFFGKNSFAPEEEFNTNIMCQVCDGLDSFSEDAGLEEQVQDVRKKMQDELYEVHSLKEVVKHEAEEIKEVKEQIKELKKPSKPAIITTMEEKKEEVKEDDEMANTTDEDLGIAEKKTDDEEVEDKDDSDDME